MADWTTRLATLPNIKRAMPERPWVLMTSTSVSPSWAVATISSGTLPGSDVQFRQDADRSALGGDLTQILFPADLGPGCGQRPAQGAAAASAPNRD